MKWQCSFAFKGWKFKYQATRHFSLGHGAVLTSHRDTWPKMVDFLSLLVGCESLSFRYKALKHHSFKTLTSLTFIFTVLQNWQVITAPKTVMRYNVMLYMTHSAYSAWWPTNSSVAVHALWGKGHIFPRKRKVDSHFLKRYFVPRLHHLFTKSQ